MKSNNNIQSKHTKTIYYVYLLINKINGKMYVGYSINPEERFKEHCKRKKHLISKAIKKHKKENFEMILLFDTLSKQEANEVEINYILHLNTTNKKIGYNVAKGGEGGNTWDNLSEEKKQKIKQNQSKRSKQYFLKETSDKKNIRILKLRNKNLGKKRPYTVLFNKQTKTFKYTQEETNFIFEQKALGLSIVKITKAFNKNFNKNISLTAIANHIRREIA